MNLNLIPFKQEGTQMYAGVMRVSDVLKLAKVDEWRQDDGAEHGYQRAPEPLRTGKIARYLQSDPKPLMPTSILLSYRGSLAPVEAGDGLVRADIPDDVDLWIVDGQHRVYGLKRAIEEFGMDRFGDYALPVSIVEFASIEDEANQFRIINETMKKVRTDLARRILALRLTSRGRLGRQELRLAGRLWEANAVEIVKILTKDEDSPWLGHIQGPNVRKQPGHVVRELSFTTSLKPILKEQPYRTWTSERLSTSLKEYWKAWRSLVPEAFDAPGDYVMMKTPGVFSLHQLAYFVFEVLRSKGISNPTASDFQNILSDLGSYATADFWSNDNAEGAGLAGSMKGFGILSDAMQEELENAGHTSN